MIKEIVLGYEYANVPANNMGSCCKTIAEAQFLHEEQTMSKAKSMLY
jgi:hypothetical protein